MPLLVIIRLTLTRSDGLSVTVKLVALVISTLLVVRLREAPLSPDSVSLLRSMSLFAPAKLKKPVPVTTSTPVLAS